MREGEDSIHLLGSNKVTQSYSADLIIRLDADDGEKWENFELLAESAWYGSSVLFLCLWQDGHGQDSPHLDALGSDRTDSISY